MSDIGLLLAQMNSGAAVLAEGLGWQTATKGGAPKQRKDEDDEDKGDLRADGADPNDLTLQRWGIVYRDTDEGRRLRQAIEPLVRKRKEDQGGHKVIEYKIPSGKTLDAAASTDWWKDVYHDDDIATEADRPRYLLILGDADVISWDFQQRLALDIFAGRLAFPTVAGYEAYANKVLKYERARLASGARGLFFTVRDGTAATNVGHRGLMIPSVNSARDGIANGTFNANEIVFLNEYDHNITAREFFQAAAQPEPTMLFSMSHGLGAPQGGWDSIAEQRRFQGSMSFGQGEQITGEDIAERPFLPGGAWFYFACLGAGTPTESAYHHWLQDLKSIGAFSGSLHNVVASLPKPGEPPFVSRLPQAALSNENGPLSVLGHVDLAWTFSFQEYSIKDGKRVTKNQARFHDIFRSLVEGRRMGAGYSALQRYFNNVNGDLTRIFDQDAKAKKRNLALDESPARQLQKASLWMERQDLAAYVLLGDPAVRLQVDSARAHADVKKPIPSATAEVASASVSSTASTTRVKKLDDVRKMEQAIFKVLHEDEDPKKIAAKLDVEPEDVRAWVENYQNAGREALRKL